MRERMAAEIQEAIASHTATDDPDKCPASTEASRNEALLDEICDLKAQKEAMQVVVQEASTDALLHEINELKAQKEAMHLVVQEASTEVVAMDGRQEMAECEIEALKDQLHESDSRAASARQVALREANAYELASTELQTQSCMENRIWEANERASSAREVALREAKAYELASSELRSQLQTKDDDDEANADLDEPEYKRNDHPVIICCWPHLNSAGQRPHLNGRMPTLQAYKLLVTWPQFPTKPVLKSTRGCLGLTRMMTMLRKFFHALGTTLHPQEVP